MCGEGDDGQARSAEEGGEVSLAPTTIMAFSTTSTEGDDADQSQLDEDVAQSPANFESETSGNDVSFVQSMPGIRRQG